MDIWSLIAAILAGGCFALSAFRARQPSPGTPFAWNFIALGLLLLTLSWILQLTILDHPVHF